MANRAAQLIAENSGYAVTKRDRHYLEFDLGGGVTRHVATIDPLHKRVDGTTEIDTTFVADTGAWQWKLASTDFQVNARSVLNAGDVVQWLDPVSGQSVILQPLALNWVDNVTDSRQQITQPQAVTAQASDCTLYWPNGYGTGRHFRYTAHPKRLVKEFIIDAAANLPAPTVANPYLEVEFILKASTGVQLFVDGVEWDRSTKTNTAQAIEFRVTATGQTAWLFDAPHARDSAALPTSTPGSMQLRRQGANRYVTVRFPKTWIDTATFPITLDPTFTDGYGGDVQTYADDVILPELATYNFGRLETPWIRATRKVLLRFALSSIAAGATCNTATLYATVLRPYTDTITAYHISDANGDWTEGSKSYELAGAGEPCWNAKVANGSGGVTTAWAGSAGLSTSGTDYNATALGSFTTASTDTSPTTYNFTLTTSVVSAWFGAASNNGLMMVGSTSGEGGSDPAIYSSDDSTTGYRPKLVVDYTAGGAATFQPRPPAAIDCLMVF